MLYDGAHPPGPMPLPSMSEPCRDALAEARVNRRSLLLSTAAAMTSGRLRAGEPGRDLAAHEDPKAVEEVRTLLRKAEIGPLRASYTEHYIASGSVPADVRLRVAEYCEALRAAAHEFFTRAGFAPRRPTVRMNFVLLGNREEFQRVRGQIGLREGSGGFYNTRLRVFVLAVGREGGDSSGPIDWGNTLYRAGHEALHQFYYHSGLLNPQGDVPDYIGEGLAMLSDPGPGMAPVLLKPTAECLATRALRVTETRLTSEALFRTDGLSVPSDAHADEWAAYVHAWLLIATLLSDEDLRAKFRAYLKAIAVRTDKTHRLDDARAHFGDLGALDVRMARHLAHLMAHPPGRYKSVRRQWGAR